MRIQPLMLFKKGLLAFTLFSCFSCKAQVLSDTNKFNMITFRPLYTLKSPNFLKRIGYAEAIMLSSSIPADFSVYAFSGKGWLQDLASIEQFKKAWSRPPLWEKDPIVFNYVVHPLMGNAFYLSSRNNKGTIAESIFITALCSASYEYFVASFNQRPSFNDMIVTPLLGSILGEFTFRLLIKMRKDGILTPFERIVYTIADPIEVLRFKFHYSKIARKD